MVIKLELSNLALILKHVDQSYELEIEIKMEFYGTDRKKKKI